MFCLISTFNIVKSSICSTLTHLQPSPNNLEYLTTYLEIMANNKVIVLELVYMCKLIHIVYFISIVERF